MILGKTKGTTIHLVLTLTQFPELTGKEVTY